MSVIKVDDGHGHSITYLDTDGYKTCTFKQPEAVATRIRQLQTFKCRPDDIFICAPVKSGTHWIWEIISMMVRGKAETVPKSKVSNMLEVASWDLLDNLESPRILNTHVNYKRLPDEAKELGCKTVFVLRNPKDLVVSLYNHVKGIPSYEYDGEWKHFLPLFLEGKTEYNSWFDHVREWEAVMTENDHLPIHLVYFENLKQKNLEEVYKLGEFLGIENRNGLFEEISDKCNFSNMVKDKQHFLAPVGTVFKEGFTFYRKVFRLIPHDDFQAPKRPSLKIKHTSEIGDWKNWFTVAQSEMFDRVYSSKMQQSKYKFIYS